MKKILAVHDLAGLGRSSLVPIIEVLGAMGHQCVPLPTAVYSSHMALAGWHGHSLTEDMRPAIAQYAALRMRFDLIYAGFLSSAEQIEFVAEAVDRLSQGQFLLDPVLGDNGKLYRSASPALCEKMRGLCERADIITPNGTEAAVLLGEPLSKTPQNETDAADWAHRLWERFQASVVLTGLSLNDRELSVACCENGTASLFSHPRRGSYYPGTGDIFAAVLAGGLVRGEPLLAAARRAAGFVERCIAAAEAQGDEPLQGVPLEPQLYRLCPGAEDSLNCTALRPPEPNF